MKNRFLLTNLKKEISPIENPLFISKPIPQATILGPECMEAVRTLLLGLSSTNNEEIKQFPWLTNTLEDALNYIEGKM